MERRNISVPKAHSGEAVARIVHDGLNVPHSTAKGLIDEGCVTINGRPARSHGQRCEGGDVVEVRYDPERKYEPHPAPRHGPGFRVVHEDLEIVVVDKTPGLLSSPAPGRRDESLAELIAESLRSRGIKKPQLFVVHRLDQHTSGLLVFARTPRAMEWLAAQFESREAGRAYTAIVQGRVERERGTIQSWLVEDSKSLSVRTTSTRGAGKRALTHFAVQERFEDATLVRVGLETGRKHQIRVHFAEIGHPVLGDRRYGDPSATLQRVALHAERLTFRHPKTLETLTFDAPWPDDLKKLVLGLRRGTGPRAEGDGEADGRDAEPRAGSPFHRDGAGAPPTPAAQGHRAVARAAGRPGSLEGRVAVFPRGLTLTDPIGPVSAWLQDGARNLVPAAVAARAPSAGTGHRAPGSAPSRGGPERASSPPGAAYARGAGDRRPDRGEMRPAGRQDRGEMYPAGRPSRGEMAPERRPDFRERGPDRVQPPRDARRAASAPVPSGDKVWRKDLSADRRERLLRERSVGNRPGTRRPRPRDPEAPPKEAPGTGSDRPRPAHNAKTFEKKPWQQGRSAKPRVDASHKPWQRDDARSARAEKPAGEGSASGRDRAASGGKPWAAKSAGAKPWAAKSAGAKPWAAKSAGAKPWAAKSTGAKPWAAKSAGAKPWAAKSAGAKPWAAKSTGAKPWAAKSAGAKPWAGKTGSANPVEKTWKARPQGAGAAAKPWRDKPHGADASAKPWRDKPDGADAAAKPWRDKPPGAAAAAKPWRDKPRGAGADAAAKPWRGKPQGGRPDGRHKPWKAKAHDAAPRGGEDRGDRTGGVKPSDAKPQARSEPRGESKPWRGKPGGAKTFGKKPWTGKPAGKKPWTGKPASSGAPPKGEAPEGHKTRARHEKKGAGGASAPRKPWEFKEKGMTLRRERRRKIASAQAKGRKGRKP